MAYEKIPKIAKIQKNYIEANNCSEFDENLLNEFVDIYEKDEEIDEEKVKKKKKKKIKKKTNKKIKKKIKKKEKMKKTSIKPII